MYRFFSKDSVISSRIACKMFSLLYKLKKDQIFISSIILNNLNFSEIPNTLIISIMCLYIYISEILLITSVILPIQLEKSDPLRIS